MQLDVFVECDAVEQIHGEEGNAAQRIDACVEDVDDVRIFPMRPPIRASWTNNSRISGRSTKCSWTNFKAHARPVPRCVARNTWAMLP